MHNDEICVYLKNMTDMIVQQKLFYVEMLNS